MGLKFNEGRACDAVIRRLERRGGALRERITRHDLDPDETHRVELTFTINGRLYALEHTGIEPFEGHIQLNNQAPDLTQPLIDLVTPLLPGKEHFELMLPHDAFRGMKRKDVGAVHAALSEWIQRVGPTLEIGPMHRRLPTMATYVHGVPFPVQLCRSEPIGGLPRFSLLHVLHGPGLEDHRRERVRRALTRKYPKLAAWKASHGARTVLVLEENDIQLTNVQLVAEAVLEAEKTIGEVADHVYLVMTCSDPWFAWHLRVDGRTYFDLDDPEERCSEFDPAQLLDLTAPAEPGHAA
jgi:hypothetical protein